jgi:hypothetical protein
MRSLKQILSYRYASIQGRIFFYCCKFDFLFLNYPLYSSFSSCCYLFLCGKTSCVIVVLLGVRTCWSNYVRSSVKCTCSFVVWYIFGFVVVLFRYLCLNHRIYRLCSMHGCTCTVGMILPIEYVTINKWSTLNAVLLIR